MDKCFPCLKWSSVTISLGTAVLCVVLVGLAAIDKKDYNSATRTTMAVLASIGVPMSVLGVWGAITHKYLMFLAFYLYVFFHCFYGIRIAINDKNFWFYPAICWLVWIPLGSFTEELRQLRNRTKHLQPI